MTVTLQPIDGGSNYYAVHGFTYAANAGWDSPNFFPIGPWEAPIFDQNDVNTYRALNWNTFFNITANTNLSLARSNGFWIIQNAADGILPGTGAETVGLLSADENLIASVNSVETTANSIQDGRFWWLQNPWPALVPNVSIDSLQPLTGSDYTMAQIMSQQWPTPNGTTRNFNVVSADLYWFSGSKDGGVLAEGGQIYGLPGPMTVAQGARGSNYGDMIDIERSYMTSDPGPIFSFIEVGEPGNSPTATAADYITPPELNWAVWSSLIHGARGIIYFNDTFSGPAQASNDVETTYYQTVQPGQTVSIYTQIQNTDALIQQLAPVINSPFALNYVTIKDDDPQDAGLPDYSFGSGIDLTQGGLEVMAKDDNGQFYIFADTRDSETETNIAATFTIADPNATSVTVVGENRTIPVVNGVFTDTFATAATVHIYEVNDGAASPPPAAGGGSPPPAPVISTGVANSNESVTLTGTAPDGSTVTVSDGGATALGTATASSTGAWSFTTADLSAGSYAFTATDTTSAGTSAASSPLDVTVPSSSPPSDPNLVANGNFATGDFTNWTLGGNYTDTTYGPEIFIDTDAEGGSTHAAGMGSVGSDGTLSQTIATTAGQTYTLSFWLQNEASGTNDFKAIWNGQTLLSLTNAAQSGYTQYTYTVTATGGTTTLEFSAANGPSQWDLDNISLTAGGSTTTTPPADPAGSTTTTPPAASGSNLVANGNFATGDFTNWTLGGNYTDTTYGPEIFIDTDAEGGSTHAAGMGSVGSDGTLSQTIATTAGQTYTLSFWLQNEASGTNDFKAIWNGQTLLSLTNAAQSGYTEHTYTVTATGSTTTLEFSAANSPSQWDLDNISLTASGTSPATTNSLAGSSGSTTIATGAMVEIAAADTASVTFQGSTGTLLLDQPSTFSGKISGFSGNGSLSGSDQIDLININYNSVHDSYANGVLTVTDGSGDTAQLSFNGSYTLANFKFASDGSGGTIVYDPPVTPSSSQNTAAPAPVAPSAPTGTGETLDPMDPPGIAFKSTLGYLPDSNQAGVIPTLAEGIPSANIALLGNYMASIFATAGGNHGTVTTLAEVAQPNDQSVLSIPHHA